MYAAGVSLETGAEDWSGSDEWRRERAVENDEDLEASRPLEIERREHYDEEERTTLEGVCEKLPEAEGNARLEEESVLSEDSGDYREGDECFPGDKNKNDDDELASSETLAALGTDEDTTIEDPPEETTTTTTESATAGEEETTTCISINVRNGEDCHRLENRPIKIEPVNYGVTTERGPLPVENVEGSASAQRGPAEGPLITPPNSDGPSGESGTDPEEASSAARESVLPEHCRLFFEAELDALEEDASPLATPELEEYDKEIEERLFPLDEIEFKKKVALNTARAREPTLEELSGLLQLPVEVLERTHEASPGKFSTPEYWLEWYRRTMAASNEAKRANRDFRKDAPSPGAVATASP
ncbi:hypothetical protein PF004_g9196 [Phytophthora fragariae]|uniref:Uncharacterized protein n=1 Tax=Phytophthora fragariae TaxID=53985 RepID=A0A6A3L7D7_9STRA|nr:hypothetical protein PF011_g9133 [Phytophthora fragariae]KAE9235084.1 hypothetical protein PF004_g9196 [Phytophthora fragariae]